MSHRDTSSPPPSDYRPPAQPVPERRPVFVEPSGGNVTRTGVPSKLAQGYGTAQGASGAAGGGADAGGSTHVSPPQQDGASAADDEARA